MSVTSQLFKKSVVLLKFSFNSVELSHSCKAPWTSESQWGSCKKDPAKGQVRNALVSTCPTPVAAVAGDGALWFLILTLPWPEAAQNRKGSSVSPRQKLFFGSASWNIVRYSDLHLKENREPHSYSLCLGIGAGHSEVRWQQTLSVASTISLNMCPGLCIA